MNEKTLQIPHTLTMTRQELLAAYGADQARYGALQKEVSEAKTRVSWQPEVQMFLDTLQQQEHERSVGAFERLLTAFLQDVLPGTREIVLDLHTEKGAPAMDVFMRKGVGKPLEDVYSGSGGSVTNVVSAGLRMIALIRSGKRPFLVLDEADCWIKPNLAPHFASVIQQASENLGLQVIMISHHDELLFGNIIPHRLRLERGARGLVAQWGDGTSPEWQEGQEGMRSILLEHCQAHTHTFLPLAPGVTLLHGDNDIGKSAVNTVLRAVFYGESNDTIVEHGATFARATFDFGPENILEWQRNLKGKHKVLYTEFSAERGREDPINKTAGARELPEWLEKFNIGLIDGLDVQLTRQKLPVFLLDLPATHRARALAVGSETGHVQTMMTLDRQDLQEAKSLVKRGEATLEQLHRRMRLAQPVVDRKDIWMKLEKEEIQIQERSLLREKMKQLSVAWSECQQRCLSYGGVRKSTFPQTPHLQMDARWQETAMRWERVTAVRDGLVILKNGSAPKEPPPPGAHALEQVVQRWLNAKLRKEALKNLPGKTEAPQLLEDSQKAKALLLRWTRAQHACNSASCLKTTTLAEPPLPPTGDHGSKLAQRWASLKEEIGNTKHQMKTINDEMESLEKEESQFNACPVCQQPLNPSHQGHTS